MGSVPLEVALFLGLVAAQRLSELVLSRRNVAGMQEMDPNAQAARAESQVGFLAMVFVHVLLIALPALEVSFFGVRGPAWLAVAALTLFLVAQALRYWTMRTLGGAWNVRAEVFPHTTLVTSGPYKYLRHPNYLAVCLEFFAIPLVVGAYYSWIFLQLLHVPILLRRIRGEERLLFSLPGYAETMGPRGRLWPRFVQAGLRQGGPR